MSLTDLGIYMAYAKRFQPLEVIFSKQLASAVAIIPITLNSEVFTEPVWIVHSFDCSGIEQCSDDWLEDMDQDD
ncbi:hypothetical protein SERLADRAFT_439912 [Serpula lacrymans var. lacrymans S7.9]|uniref:Uncharacterized protein n=1 Tax=Serpula lacrymans var. lacrymans (strain S7.9) TaxID=578457 RepID=F8P1Z5_SERL9|nr:uncharacterized protein SERLADRAFT_439912 [Serpula lacrymans var. lacrymans S7.9]EGO23173.1 hypothetical protein SERLADRAFT_439912 [Serpula lacrymans var. lacrymans S7.9]